MTMLQHHFKIQVSAFKKDGTSCEEEIQYPAYLYCMREHISEGYRKLLDDQGFGDILIIICTYCHRCGEWGRDELMYWEGEELVCEECESQIKMDKKLKIEEKSTKK